MTPERAEELLEAAGRTRILVVGDLMLDRYVSGSVDRISPEAPVPIVRVEEEWDALGGAGNVAANVRALGATCALVGCAAEDEAGFILRAELEAVGVATDAVVVSHDRPTTVKTRVMSRRSQIARLDREVEADVGPETAARLCGAVAELAAICDAIIIQDYNKGVLVPAVIESVLTAARVHGVPCVVDPKRRNFFAYAGATVFKPNAKELGDATGNVVRADDPEWMEAIRAKLDCAYLFLTLGEHGVAWVGRDASLARVPTVARSVYDVSGAGDTVTAVVATVLAAGGSVAEAAVLANHAAAVEVGKVGVATVTAQEIRDHLWSAMLEPSGHIRHSPHVHHEEAGR
ncbi:MAG: bifunctional ADP-heptose synthase [Gemmatimonadetes bacterium]|nr:bifunctional ADP-heptose synthase [Gemmatimonadota bacterium]MDA1103221.1 bifunctional ADP-heptose synthase [Gemmatimonadota bacterium]